jgi:hypothetical protein
MKGYKEGLQTVRLAEPFWKYQRKLFCFLHLVSELACFQYYILPIHTDAQSIC